jgi:hypothetical protein
LPFPSRMCPTSSRLIDAPSLRRRGVRRVGPNVLCRDDVSNAAERGSVVVHASAPSSRAAPNATSQTPRIKSVVPARWCGGARVELGSDCLQARDLWLWKHSGDGATLKDMNGFQQIIADLRDPTRELSRAIPETWAGFAAMHQAVVADGNAVAS